MHPRPEYVIPPEYKEISYLGFTGSQWFDTGLRFNNNTRIEIDFTPSSTSNTGNQMFFGAYDGTYNCVLAKSNNSYNMVYQHGAMGGGSYTETFQLTQQEYLARKQVVADGENSIDISGNIKAITNTHTFTCSLTTYLGNVHRATGSYPAYMICGMYDVVNNTFKPSITGTDFIKGADL